jgi:tetratricopeptide (TPR) repeat protein
MKNRMNFCNKKYLGEIDGYMELGMQEEALTMIRATLDKREISEEEFHTCVFALLRSEHPRSFKRVVEHAYGQFSQPTDDRVRSAMLNYYFSIDEAARAFEFFPRRPTKFFDAWTMMQVCLELGRLDEAKKVARYCSSLLATADDDFTRASMADALASYCLWIGDPESALKLWREAPAEPTFQRQRFCGIVKAQLLQALQAAKVGLVTLARQNGSDPSSEIRLPGNAATPISDAERELKDLQDGIKRLVPEMVEANPARARAH